MWEKRTLWENAARVPLVIRAPWLAKGVGTRSGELVELVDLYRTILDVAGAPEPATDSVPIEGTSMAPLLGGGGEWKAKPALTMYPRCMSLVITVAALVQAQYQPSSALDSRGRSRDANRYHESS